MTDLLDLLREQDHAVDPRRDWCHVTLPNMAYACDGNLVDGLADGGPRGTWILGANEREWPKVTCPVCRGQGRRELSRRCHMQQKPVGHVCPAPDQPDANPQCSHWQTIPEEK